MFALMEEEVYWVNYGDKEDKFTDDKDGGIVLVQKIHNVVPLASI